MIIPMLTKKYDQNILKSMASLISFFGSPSEDFWDLILENTVQIKAVVVNNKIDVIDLKLKI